MQRGAVFLAARLSSPWSPRLGGTKDRDALATSHDLYTVSIWFQPEPRSVGCSSARGGAMWTKIDSALVWPNGKAYFFFGDEYVRYDIEADRVDDGYPLPIAGNWPGLWVPVGAGVVWPNDKAYFLRGSDYVRYDITEDRVDDGYPLPIAGNWRGLSLSRVDAAIVWPNNKAYLFGHYNTGAPFGADGYVRYDIDQDQQDPGYPASVEANWTGLHSPIDAVAVWPNGKAYFFQGNWYSRYDIKADSVDDGYPLPILDNWPGIPITAPGPLSPPL